MIEVLKQALDAFHQIFESTPVYHNDGTCIINDKSIELSNKAIASLRQAIKELESQEPWCMKMNGCKTKCEDCPDEPPPQRTWVGLAKEDRLCAKYMQDAPDGIEAVIDYIESKLKELNT
jgi:hypothetical protein